MQLKEISLQDIAGLRIGHAQDHQAKTGVTVLSFPQGARAGVDISGGGPASRETPVLSPLTADVPVHAIVLSGGSAFGLAAADGVMACLEERGIGYDTGFALVPILCQSCIYDMGYGSSKVRPTKEMGYRACAHALDCNQHPEGNYGGGTGATVGKIAGMNRATKGGLGIYAVEVAGLQMAAIVVVNALGDVFSATTGEKLAGLTTPNREGWSDIREALYAFTQSTDLFTRNNTTISAIVTNGDFTKAQLTKLAAMATSAYARCINPVGTLADGDTVYAASVGTHPADLNMAGTLAAQVLAEAIQRAVVTARISEEEFLGNIAGK
ncbi:MAG: P1 family peptidase [Spirochaetaceae bacterium]|nr:P1 family peptidase [Spirochaetaceae bacterium]